MKKTIKSNIILNCLKTATNVVFPLITFPYVSRVLGTVGIGKVNFSNSIISYFAILSALGVTTYAIREGSAVKAREKERNQFFNQAFTINFIFMCIAYLALLVTVIVSVKLHDYYLLLIVHSLAIFFNWIGVEWIFNIYEDYLYITIRAVLIQVVSLFFMFLLVRTQEDYLKYACITVFASGGSCFFNYIYAGKYYRPHITVKCEIRRHIKPMLILAANLIAITVYVNADSTMIGVMLDDHEVGLYATSVKVYTIIKHIMNAVIVSATARVSFYFLNGEEKNYLQLLEKMAKALLMLSLPAMAGLYMTSNDIISLLAGNEYIAAAPSLRVLSFSIVCATFGAFFSTYGLIVKRQEKSVLIITIVSALINVGLNFLFIPLLGIKGAAYTTLISELFVFIACFAKANVKIMNRLMHTIVSVIMGLVWIVLICILLWKVKVMILRLGLSIVLSVIGYTMVLFLRKEDIVIVEITKIKAALFHRHN